MQAKSTKFNPLASQVFSTFNYKKHLLWFAVFVFTIGTGYALYQPVHPDPWHVHSGLDKFIYPQEQNAFLRQPSISRNIKGIAAIDDHLWAVGDGGLILHSEDGGQCWTPQGPWMKKIGETRCAQKKTGLQRIFSGLSASVESDSLLNDLFPGAYAAEAPESKQSQTVVKKNDLQVSPAQSIEQKFIPEEPAQAKAPVKSIEANTPSQVEQKAGQSGNDLAAIPDLEAVAFFNKNIGLAVGDKGIIIRTKDGGASWHSIDSGSRSLLNSIGVLGNKRIIAAGADGTILRSSDGGDSWAAVDSGTRSQLFSIGVLGNNRIIAVGSMGTILRSSDGGASWAAVDSGTRSQLISIGVLDNKRIIAVGEEGTILRSSDDGASWAAVDSGTRSQLFSIGVLDNNRIIAVGSEGTILRSSDGGASWAAVDSGTRSQLASIGVLDNKRIIAVGRGGTILRSSDDGASWAAADSGTRSWLFSIGVLDNNRIIAVGSEGTILRSSDGGVSWAAVDSGTRTVLISIGVLDNKRIIAVGRGGTIHRSIDGGASWAAADSGTRSQLISIGVLDNNRIIAVGSEGTILRSSDGGASWAAADSGTRSRLNSIGVLGNNRIIAVGEKGTILRSSDGGASWAAADSGTRSWLNSIGVLGNNRIIAVGGEGTILRSSDGGASWAAVDSGTRSVLMSIGVLDNNRIIAVGEEGTILRSSNGGASWAAVDSGTRSRLNSIGVLGNNQIIAVGGEGTILRSNNGGESWARIGEYSVSLANWWYLLIALLIGLVLLAVWPRIEPADDDGIAGLAASDKPLQPGEPDALNLAGIAADITAFLSNPKTTAPLTMAITGPWGSGKSSLMNLVRADLKEKGFSPVWFNAWHHQKGEQLLASLFAHIKDQAIPSWFSFDGLWFRFKLAFIRGRRHWFIFAIMMALLFLTLSLNKQALTDVFLKLSLLSNPEFWWHIPWHDWMPHFQAPSQGDWIQTLASIFGIGTPLVALLRSVRGFTTSPSRLVSINHGGESKKDYDPGARARFAKEFQDVTQALGNNKMVIFIDDLDRCSQTNLIDILENINFISSSGDCFLLLGMAPKYIEACVANHYASLAKSIAEKELYENKNHIDDQETHKFRFAHNYLEKMINIEVTVPQMQSSSIDLLLNLKSQVKPKNSWLSLFNTSARSLNKALNIIIPVLFILLAIGTGWEYGRKIPDKPVAEPKPVYNLLPADKEMLLSLSKLDFSAGINKRLSEQTTDSGTREPINLFSIALQGDKTQLEKGIKIGTLGKGKNKANLLLKLNPEIAKLDLKAKDTADKKTVATEKSSASSEGQAAEFRQGLTETGARLSALWLLFGLSVFISFTFYLYRKKKDKYAEDSDDFKQSLSLWTPWIQLKQETPRAIKRFLNHLRFLAIRNNKEMNESMLVAMATIYFFNADWLMDATRFKLLSEQNLFDLLVVDYRLDEQSKEQQDDLKVALTALSERLNTVLNKVNIEELSENRDRAIKILSSAMPVTHR